ERSPGDPDAIAVLHAPQTLSVPGVERAGGVVRESGEDVHPVPAAPEFTGDVVREGHGFGGVPLAEERDLQRRVHVAGTPRTVVAGGTLRTTQAAAPTTALAPRLRF